MAVFMVTTAQVRTIRSIAHGRLGWSNEEYHRWLRERGGPASTLTLTRAQAANVIDMLKAVALGLRVRVWHVDQATILQQDEIEHLGTELDAGEALAGIVHKATRGRTNRVSAMTIWEARDVVEALKDIACRRRRQATQGRLSRQGRRKADDPQPEGGGPEPAPMPVV